MIGDTRILSDGSIEKVIAETLIQNYCYETKDEEKARVKKGLPAPMYSYTAVKVKRVKA
jgi:hypothetical protein